MIGHSDDAKVIELLAPLRRLQPVPFRASHPEGRRWFRRPVVVVAVAVAGLALVGVAIANGFGVFDGISAAQRPQTPAALKWAKEFQATCKETPQSDSSVYFPSATWCSPVRVFSAPAAGSTS